MTGYLFYMVAGISFSVAAAAQHTGFVTEPEGDRSSKKIVLGAPPATPPYSFDLTHNGPLEETEGRRLIYKTQVKNHRLHGSWQSWYASGQMLDSGQLIHGIPDGEWRYFDSSGQLVSLRQYDAGKLRRVKEEWRNAHPKRSFYALTEMYSKDPAAARYHASAAHSFPSDGYQHKRSLAETVLANRVATGNYRPLYEEGLLHGLYLNYFSNGLVRDSGYYKEGLKDGVWLHRYSVGGSWFMGAYKNGMRQYEWKQYDAAGKLKAIIFYNRKGEEEWRK